MIEHTSGIDLNQVLTFRIPSQRVFSGKTTMEHKLPYIHVCLEA